MTNEGAGEAEAPGEARRGRKPAQTAAGWRGSARARRIALVGLGIAAAAGVAAAVTFSPLADVNEVTVYGLQRVALAEASAALDIEPGAALVRVNTGEAERRLREIPWVNTAEVRRSWRGRVTVTVTERTPVALALREPGHWVLVDNDGRVLSEPLDDPPLLARITGVRAAPAPGGFMDSDSEAPLAVLAGLTATAPSAGDATVPALLRPSDVAAVWRDPVHGLVADIWIERHGAGGLSGGLRVIVGDDTQLRSKAVAVATVLERGELSNPQQTTVGDVPIGPTWVLDVSVPHLPVERLA